MDSDESILTAFLEESRENLDTYDQDLMALEAGDDAEARTARLFRTLHTIKGTCGFLVLPRLEMLAHAGESTLGELRAHRLRPTPSVVRALLALGDRIRHVLGRIEAGDGHDEPLEDADRACLDALSRAAKPDLSAPRPETPVEQSVPGWERRRPDSSLRVDTLLLDRLMNLVGELVLARNQVVDRAFTTQDPRLQAATGQLDRVTAELQDAVTRVRLQPIGTLVAPLPRLVHDLSAELGKEVSLVVEGEQTLLDKAVLDAVRDPLTHLVRNAVDHGIETPSARVACGKQPRGSVVLRAFSGGGQVAIEVADDGAGIDTDAVVARAVELGIVTADEAARLGEREVSDLLFHPGLSTRTEVTSVSGRGVGADIVRANVGRVGGTVDVTTRPGRGTEFRIRIPITLAIISALLVVVDDTTYAIPQSHVVELVRVYGGDDDQSIVTMMAGSPVLRLRGELLPLVDVSTVLGVSGDEPIDPYVVVVSVNGRRIGLLLDGVRDTCEIVVKPLGVSLGRIPAYAGATVLGDGSVALILDVPGLVISSGVGEVEAGTTHEPESIASESAGQRSYLMLRAPDDGAMAVPLDRVVRLHEFAAEDIEPHGLHYAVRYGDQILPLATVAELLPERRSDDRVRVSLTGPQVPVVVCQTAHGEVGFVVGQILDIAQSDIKPSHHATRDGVAESLLIGGRIAEVLDVDRLAELAGQQVRAL
jgi:two-component system, chemotaxis family, sensor kinase CheA